MATFQYSAFSSAGQKFYGERESETKDEVASYLTSQGLSIISIQEKLNFNFKKLSKIEVGGMSLTDKVILVKQMATMFSAGIPLIQSIDILIQQTEKENAKNKLQRIYKAIEGGSSLNQAFRKEGGIFSEVQLNLLDAGEKSGNLNEMLLKIADDLEKNKDLRGKIVGAMVYPILLFSVMLVVLALMIIFMIPQVKELYKSVNPDAKLPFITNLLVSVGTFLGSPLNLLVFAIIVTSLFLLFKYYSSTTEGRKNVDRLKFKIPIFGKLSKKIEIVQFCRVLSMLIQSGVPLIEAIEIVGTSMNSVLYKDLLKAAKIDVTKGSAFSIAIAKNDQEKIFPLILLKTMATAEEAGKLDKILEDMGRFYETEVNDITNNLTKLMEPFILILVGGMVAFLAISVYLPIYQIGNYLQ